jgi:2-dehydropantoate 2-reductase
MNIVILGAGALGSIIGGHLARAGAQVTVIARGQRAAFLQQHGISLTGLANFTVPVQVITNPREVHAADVLIVAVKTADTEAALASVRHVQIGSALSIQNGVLKDEQLARTFGTDKTLGAAAIISGEVTANGSVHFTLNDYLALGELPQGTSGRVQALVNALSRSGLRAEVSPQIQTVEWSKYALFVSMMAPAALTRLETYKVYSDPDIACIVARLIHETARLAAQRHISLEDRGLLPIKTLGSMSLDDAVAHIRRVGKTLATRAPTHKISTLQDLERGRRLEVEETLGYAVQLGGELNVPLPTIELCYRLLAGINRFLQ